MSKVWLVTGSASGLGRNVAEAVLASGMYSRIAIGHLRVNGVAAFSVGPLREFTGRPIWTVAS
jgi:NAD(P)-dependent dehydrogenase (short-subunit alcohol dehydrogenase family)